MAYLRNKLAEWIPALLAALLFTGLLSPDGAAIPVQTWTYEGICRELVAGTTSCSMCRRMVINAGISTVIIRETGNDYTIVNVRDWIFNDDSLTGKYGY